MAMNTNNSYELEYMAREHTDSLYAWAQQQHRLRGVASTGKLNRLPVILCSFILIGAALIYFVS
jgi:hypothetical protein